MKTMLTKMDHSLNLALKAVAKGGVVKFTLQELTEAALLLLLAGKGLVKSTSQAEEFGVSERAMYIFKRVMQGRPW